MSTATAPIIELTRDALAGLSHHEYYGTLALSLSAHGEYSGVCWEELAHAVLGRVEDRDWAAKSLISDALDRAIEGGHRGP